MLKFILLFYYILFIQKCYNLQILSPENNSLYLILPSFSSTQIPIRYLLDDNENNIEINQDNSVCMKLILLKSDDTQEDIIIFENYCLNKFQNHLNLNHITKGKYLLSFYFLNHEQTPSSPSSSSLETNSTSYGTYETYFNVVELEDILPKLIGPPDQEYLANSLTNSSDAVFEYNLSETMLTKYLLVCLEITPIYPSTFHGPRSCVHSDQNQVRLYNVPAGKYNLELELQYISNPFTIYSQSKTTSIIHIHQLDDILPTLHLQNKNIEYGIDHGKHYVDEISISVSTKMNLLYPNIELLSHTDTCLYLYSNSTKGISKMSHCIVSAPNLKFNLQKIPHGIHNFTLSLRSHHHPEVTFPHSQIEGKIIVEHMTEFIPSYDWKELKPWHTIPSGVETRLPIGSFGRKEARIPQPWRLQASMPNPCKYFLRMDISRMTKIKQIKENAASKCKKPVNCFKILLSNDEISLDDDETSESLNLFLNPIEILYISSNEGCE